MLISRTDKQRVGKSEAFLVSYIVQGTDQLGSRDSEDIQRYCFFFFEGGACERELKGIGSSSDGIYNCI